MHLSNGLRKILVRARCLARLVVSRHKATEEEEENALVGNTIMLAQPRTSNVLAKSPPSVEEQLPFLNVVFTQD